MHKLKAYGAAALLAAYVIAGGVSYAQDSTATPAPASTQAASAPAQAQRTWLGVAVSDDGTGVTITRVVANSPAATAQLQVGDVITAVNGTAVDTAADLQKIIQAAAVGDKVTLTIERNSAQSSVDVTLGSQPVGGPLFNDPLRMAERALGAQLESAADGYQVTAVDSNSPFSLQVGDVITQVNGTAIASLDWRTLFAPPSGDTSATPTAPTLTLTVERNGASVTVSGQLTMAGRGGFRGGRGGQPGGFPGGFPGGNGGQPGGNPPNGFPGSNGQPNGNGNNNQPNNPPAGGGAI